MNRVTVLPEELPEVGFCMGLQHSTLSGLSFTDLSNKPVGVQNGLIIIVNIKFNWTFRLVYKLIVV